MINIISHNGKPGYGVFGYVVDYEADLPNLYYKDCAPGSEAYCVENSKTYIFNSQGEWKSKSIFPTSEVETIAPPADTSTDKGKWVMFKYTYNKDGKKVLVGINNETTGSTNTDSLIYASLNDLLAYATKTYVNQKFGTIDLTAYVTEQELEEKVNAMLFGAASIDDIAAKLEGDESNVKIYLTDDITVDTLTIPAGKTVTLDLGGKTLTSTANSNFINVNGNLTVTNGTIAAKQRAIVVFNNSSLTVDGATVTSQTSNALNARGAGSSITVNSGTITAREYGVLGMDGSTIVINGGNITGQDNFAIGGNGSPYVDANGNVTTDVSLKDHDQAPVNVTINGGTLEGQIVSAGYIATAIYWPSAGTLTINGGDIKGAAGVVQRGGTVIINEGAKITANGASGVKGKAGDSRIVVGPYAVVFDTESNYPFKDGMTCTIAAGAQLSGTDGAISKLPVDAEGLTDNR